MNDVAEDPAGKPSIPIALGIFVGLVASLVQSLGLTIQRKSHLQNDDRPVEYQKKAHRRPLWLLGFAIFISSNLFGTIFQIGALPIVILAPLGAVSLLWNALLSRLLLRERFSTSTFLGTLLIATGASLIAIFGVVPESTHSLDELLELFARKGFAVYFSLMWAVVIGVLVVSHLIEWRIRGSSHIALPTDEDDRESPPISPSTSVAPSLLENRTSIPIHITRGNRRWSAPSTAPNANGIPGTLPVPLAGEGHIVLNGRENERHGQNQMDKMKQLGVSTPSKRARFVEGAEQAQGKETGNMVPPEDSIGKPNAKTLTLLGMSFAAASGTLSGMCLLLAKCAVELVILSFSPHGSNQFKRVQSWVLLLGLGAAALAQLFYLNHSLRLAGPALICPLAFCFYNISSIFDGLVFYSQFAELKPYQIALVSVGIAVLLGGVYSVSAVQSQTGQGGVEIRDWAEESVIFSDEAEDEERAILIGEYVDEPTVYLDGSAIESPGIYSPTSLRMPSTPTMPSTPQTPSSPWSPTQRKRHHSSQHGHHPSTPTRFGTLIPELAPPPGIPTGFSIGFNTSSPGFMLRSVGHPEHGEGVHGHTSHARGPGRKGRSVSEGRIHLPRYGADGTSDLDARKVGVLLPRTGDLVSETAEVSQARAEEELSTWDAESERDGKNETNWFRRLGNMMTRKKPKIRL